MVAAVYARPGMRPGVAITCLCLAGPLAVAGCGDDDDDLPTPAGPPPLATKSIGAYKFDNPAVAEDADAARRATARYLDEKLARADGYEPQPSTENPVCNDPPGKGNGGIEYLNEGLVDAEPDVRSPAVLYYEPDEFGGRRLTALQYRVPDGTTDAELFGERVQRLADGLALPLQPGRAVRGRERHLQVPAGAAEDAASAASAAWRWGSGRTASGRRRRRAASGRGGGGGPPPGQ